MKLVRESLTPLFEIGEANVKPYDIKYLGYLKTWEKVDVKDRMMTGYSFITEDGDEYLMTFLPMENSKIIDGKVFNVRADFIVKGRDPRKPVNKGHLFKVLSTVLKITKDYIKRFPHTFSIVLVPGKNPDGKETRYKIYLKYIESHLPPGWKSTVHDNPHAMQWESSNVIQLLHENNYEKYKELKNKQTYEEFSKS